MSSISSGTTSTTGYVVSSDTTGALVLKTGSSATTAVTIDTSQNVGLGVTPSAWSTGKTLQIGHVGNAFLFGASSVGSSTSYGINAYFNSGWKYGDSGYATRYSQDSAGGSHLWFTAPSGTAGNAITFTQAMTLDASSNLFVGWTPTGSGEAKFAIRPSSTYGMWVSNGFANSTPYGLEFGLQPGHGSYRSAIRGAPSNYGGDDSGILLFYTSNSYNTGALTERARITAGGFFKASTTGAYAGGSSHEFRTSIDGNYSLTVTNTASSPFGFYVGYTAAAPNNTTNRFIDCEDSSALRFQVRSNGGIANYSANNVNLSDRREKTNFAPAKSYLDVICAIPVQTFNYIDQNLETDDGLTLGVVAQDVQAVAPELVMESNWAGKDEDPKMRLSIYQTDLQYALMKCIQEQQIIIQQLQADVAILKGVQQ